MLCAVVLRRRFGLFDGGGSTLVGPFFLYDILRITK